MEVFLALLLTALFVVFLVNNSSLKKELQVLRDEVRKLRLSIGELVNASAVTSKDSKTEKPAKPEILADILPGSLGGVVVETIPPLDIEPILVSDEPHVSVSQVVEKVQKPFIPNKPARKKIDFEKFIGENLMSKIGIVVLVLGIGYFVKYAIDKNWINEYGRVGIGVLTGGVMIAIAFRMRKLYNTFSSLLTGGGIGVLYLTIAIGFHQYKIFTQPAAFIILVLITIFSVILSLFYDKKELAIFSQFGGFAVPFMISTGSGNYVILFSYLLILNTGMLSIAYFKRWNILNLLCFAVTYILFFGWLLSEYKSAAIQPHVGAMVFAILFYLIFFLSNIINNLKENRKLNAAEITMILSDNLFLLLSGLIILQTVQEGIFRGLFVALLGIFNFAWVAVLYRKQQIDKVLIFLLIALVMSFISLAVPIQLKGHSITLFWTAEFVILLWLWQRSQIQLLKAGHLVVLLLAFISLVMDWNNLYFDSENILPVLRNRAFITGIIVVSGLLVAFFLLKNEAEGPFVKRLMGVKVYRAIVVIGLLIGGYCVLYIELWYQMNRFYDNQAFRQTVYAVFNFSYLAGTLVAVRKFRPQISVSRLQLVITAALFIFVAFYLPQIVRSRNYYLYTEGALLSTYNFHYLVYLPIVWLLVEIYRFIFGAKKENPRMNSFCIWFTTLFIVITLSVELDNLVLVLNRAIDTEYYLLLKQTHKIGYPILWGVSAFILMVIGMKMKIRELRIQSIILLGIILLKLVVIDVWKMGEAGRIATFIFLGLILLVISFLYQKLKQILLDNSNEIPASKVE